MSPRMSAERRREEIIGAAMPLIAAKGYDGVTTKEIAAAAQVSEALLYRHFSSKRALYDAMRSHCIAEAHAEVAKLELLPDNAETLILSIYVLMRKVRFGGGNTHHENLRRLLMRSLLAEGRFARSFVGEISAPWVSKMRRCVEGAVEAGELEGVLAEIESKIWYAHHLASAMGMYSLPSEEVVDIGTSDPETAFERAVVFCLKGVGFTDAILDKYYRPETYKLLLNAA